MDWKIQNIIHERRLKEGLPQFQFKSESTYQKVFVPIDMACRGQQYPKVYMNKVGWQRERIAIFNIIALLERISRGQQVKCLI